MKIKLPEYNKTRAICKTKLKIIYTWYIKAKNYDKKSPYCRIDQIKITLFSYNKEFLFYYKN